jgi:hypothetical protein
MNLKGSMSIFMHFSHSYAAYAAQDVNTAISLSAYIAKNSGLFFYSMIFLDLPQDIRFETVSEDFPKSFLKASDAI